MAHSGPTGSIDQPSDHSPGTEGKIGMDICDHFQNSHIGSVVCGLRVIPAGKAKWGAKMKNQKQ